MQNLNRVLGFIDGISEWLGKIVSYLIFPLMGVVVFEVAMRYLLRKSQLWVPETSEFLYGTIFVLGGAYAFIHGGYVRMDAIWGRFSARTKAVVDICTCILAFIFVGVLVWKGWTSGYDSLMMLEKSQTAWSPPLYPVKLLIPIGAGLVFLELLVKLVRDLRTALRGKKS